MSANPGVNIIEWVSRTQGLEADNEKLKKQLREIKEEMKGTVAVAKDLEKERSAAAKAEEQRAKRELSDIQRLEKERERIARQELTDIHKLDMARADYIDREKKGELARMSEERSRLLKNETQQVESMTSAVRGGLTSAFTALGGRILSVVGALGFIKAGIDDARKIAQEAGDRLSANDPSKADLASYLPTSQLAAGQAAVDRLRSEENMPEADAKNLYKEAWRAGKTDAINFAGSLGDIGYDATKGMQAHRVFSEKFGKQGRFRDFMDRFAVAQEATGTPVDEIMAAGTSAAEFAQGVSADKMTATAAVLGQRFKDPGVVSTRLSAMFKKLPGLRKHLPDEMKGVGDLDLVMRLGELEASGQVLSDKGTATTVADVIGRGGTGVMNTIGFLQKDAGKIQSVESAIQNAPRGQAIGARFAAMRGDPRRASVDTLDRATGTAEVYYEKTEGVANRLAEAYMKERKLSVGQNQELFGLSAYADDATMRATRWMKGDQDFLRYVAGPNLITGSPDRLGGTSEETARQIREFVAALNNNTAATQANTNSTQNKSLSNANDDSK